MKKIIQDALQIFKACVDSVRPALLMQQHLHADKSIRIGHHNLERSSINRLIIIAAGKAAASMAQQAEKQLGNVITAGTCVTKYGHTLQLKNIKLIEAGHPIPDENSLHAGAEIESLLENLTDKDVVLVLLSGGASALIESLPDGIQLSDVQQTINGLIRSGAGIHEINTVRKHISKLKGGGIARTAYPAQVHTLVLSDVTGDDLDVIASGPTVPDTSFFQDAYKVLTKYNLWQSTSQSIKMHLNDGLNNLINETPKAGDSIFDNCFTTIIGSNKIALNAASQEAELLGYNTGIFKENVTDNTELLARSMVKKLCNYEGTLPACFLTGGETTLQVKGNGLGGRNQHFVLCALDEMINGFDQDCKNNLTILSAGTDGTDGPTDATGAFADLDNYINNKEAVRTEIKRSLEEFDSYHFF